MKNIISHQIKPSRIHSVFLILCGSIMFNLSMTFMKSLSQEVQPIILVSVRLILGLLILIPLLIKDFKLIVRTEKIRLHLFRIVFICLAMILTYSAYSVLPISLAVALGFTSPLITSTLAFIFLLERFNFLRLFVILLGYIGVLIIVHPNNFLRSSNILIALSANVFSSLSFLLARQLLKTETIKQLLFYSNAGPCFITLILSILLVKPVELDSIDLFFIILSGLFGFLSQFCWLKAIENSDLSFLAPFEYFRLIFAIPIGFFLFSESIDLWFLIGSSIIITSSWYLFLKEKKMV